MSAMPSWTARLRHARQALVSTALLIVIAAIAAAIGTPAWVRAPLCAVALVAALVFSLPRLRGREPVDTALRIVGGAAVLLVLLGLVLDLLPIGLTTPGWAVGVGAIELVIVLIVARREPVPPTGRLRRRVVALGGRRIVAGAAWGVLTVGILTGALLLAIGSYDRTHIAPVALGATTSGGSIVVTVTSGAAAGGLEVRLVPDSGSASTLARDVTVGPGERPVSVRVPTSTVGRIELVAPGSDRPLRTLILDGTHATTGDG